MSLDQNLFTLHFTPHTDNANVIDLVDPSGTIHYRKQRISCPEYKIEIYDPMSESLLASATAPSPVSKLKTLELYNPTSVLELKYTGSLSFRWAFKWEDHGFEWKREECFMIRKPDPPVIVAVTKEMPGRLKTQSVQILDYNLNRFDIDDRKGLEIVILTALMTFQDANEAYHNPAVGASPQSNSTIIRSPPVILSPPVATETAALPPPPPPKPAPKTGIDRIAELQAIQGEYNEIVIGDEGEVRDYGQYCSNLLQDDAMLFITVKCSEAEYVPKVLQIVEETKRIRHKAGLTDDEELHQYVLYDIQEAKKGPRRINLDDQPKNRYEPPKDLTVHLSKISMPELQPKGHVKDKPTKEAKKKEDKKGSAPPIITSKYSPASSNISATAASTTSKPSGNKLQRPQGASSPNQRSNLHPTPMNSNQPSPMSSTSSPYNYSSSPAAPSFPMPYGRGGPPVSSYGAHARHSSVTSGAPALSGQNDYNWTGNSTGSPIHQPQPVLAAQAPPNSKPLSPGASVAQGASTVVQGLMDKLLTHRR